MGRGWLLVGIILIAISVGIVYPLTIGPYLIAVLILLGEWFLAVLLILVSVWFLVWGFFRRG